MTYLIPTILFFIIFAYITKRDFRQGVFILMMLLPAYLIRFDIGPLPSTALEVMIGIILLIWIFKRGKNIDWKHLKESSFFWPGLLLVGASGLSIIWATDTQSALGIWKAYFIEPFLIYLILIDTIKTREEWKKLLSAFGISVLALTLLAIIQRITGFWSPTWEWTVPGSRRVTSLFTSPNSLGLFVGPITTIYIGWLLLSKKDFKWFHYLVVFAGATSILLAVSRGALIALLVGIFFLLYKGWSKKWSIIIYSLALLVVIIIPTTRAKVFSLATFQIDSGESRLELYQGSLELLKKNPIKGLGLASFADRFEEVRGNEFTEKLIYPHNIFLNFWTETGLLGLISILWMIGIVFIQIKRSQQFDWNLIFASALLVILVHGLIDVPYFKNDLAILTWFVLAGTHPPTPSLGKRGGARLREDL